MNCRGCGRPIPERYLRLDSFECPYCSRKYHRRPSVNASDVNTRQPDAKEQVKYPKKKYTWVKVCIFVIIAILMMVYLDREYGFFGLLGGGVFLGIVLGVLYGIAKIKYEKKNPTVQIEIVNKVKQGNRSLVTFREIHADGNAEIKLIRSNSAQYPLELTLMQTLENTRRNKATSPVETPTRTDVSNLSQREDAPTQPKTVSLPGEKHYVAGTSFRQEEIASLGELSNEYEYSKKDLIDCGLTDERIYEMTFSPRMIQLVEEPNNPHDPNAIKVVIDGVHVGYIKRGSTAHIKKLLHSGTIKEITAWIGGGKYKIVESDYDDEHDRETYTLEKGETDYSVSIRIVTE